MANTGYASTQGNDNYSIIWETNFSDNCTTNACRLFPYVKCGSNCDSQCVRMKEPQTAKYDFDFDGAGCLSGMAGACGCTATRSLYFKRYQSQ